MHQHLALVEPIALHFANRCWEDPDDLLQVGRLGLICAARRFDPQRGVPFKAFAKPVIRGEILHHLRDRFHLVRPPRAVAELRDRVVRCQWTYRQKYGREPSRETLQQELGVDGAHLEQATVFCRQRPASLTEVRAEPPCRRGSATDAIWADQCSALVRRGLAQLEQDKRWLLVAVHCHKRSLRSLARDAATYPMCIQRQLKRAEAQLRQILETQGVCSEQLD